MVFLIFKDKMNTCQNIRHNSHVRLHGHRWVKRIIGDVDDSH